MKEKERGKRITLDFANDFVVNLILEISVEYGLKHSDIDVEEIFVAGAAGYVSALNNNKNKSEINLDDSEIRKSVIRQEIEKFIKFHYEEKEKRRKRIEDSVRFSDKMIIQVQEEKECRIVVESRLTDIPRKGKKPKTINIYACSICGYNLGELPCDSRYCCGCGSKIMNANEVM